MNGPTASAGGDPSASGVVTTAPTSASCASVGPAPSSSPSCQATTAAASGTEGERDDGRHPGGGAAHQAAAPASRPTPASTSTKTASSATSSSCDGLRRSRPGPSRGDPEVRPRRQPPPQPGRPGRPARASASDEAQRAAQVRPDLRPAPPVGRGRRGAGVGTSAAAVLTAASEQRPAARRRPVRRRTGSAGAPLPGGTGPRAHSRATLVGPSSALMSPISAVLGPHPQPLVEPQHRLAAAVDQLELHLGGAGVAAQHLAQPLDDRRGAAGGGHRDQHRPARALGELGDGHLGGEQRRLVVPPADPALDHDDLVADDLVRDLAPRSSGRTAPRCRTRGPPAWRSPRARPACWCAGRPR